MPHRSVPKPRRTNARGLRSNMTDAERKLWYRLRAHRFNGASFRRQVPIGPYIVDFVCLQARLIVEVDGGQHGADRDAVRDAWLRRQSFRVLRFWNNDVHSNIDGVLQVIADALAQALPPSLTLPRKGGGDYAESVDRPCHASTSQNDARHKRGLTSPLAGEVGGEAAGRGVGTHTLSEES
jgi:very-short-patch-repair endonuclease